MAKKARPKNGDKKEVVNGDKKEVVPFIGKDVKKSVGLAVVCLGGVKGLFPDGCRWSWVSYAGVGYCEITDKKGTVWAQYRQDQVVAVTGPQTLFRDSFWK